jgi:phosphate transport system substrate-binding protein
MEKLIFPLFLFILFGCIPEQKNRMNSENLNLSRVDTIKMAACYSSRRMVEKWVEEFQKTHPDIHFGLEFDESSSCVSSLSHGSHLAFISRELIMEEDSLPYCVSAVAKHGLVIIVNEKNPYIELIKKGVTINSLKAIYEQGSWYAIANDNKYPLHIYYRTIGAGNTKNFMDFLDLDEAYLTGRLVETDIDMVDSIKNDPLGLGYCSHINAYDLNTNAQAKGIVVVPLKDNLGRTYHFYDSLNLLKRVIWAGKYQCHLFPTLYLVIKDKPEDQNIKEFLKWVFTDGQEVSEKEGYIKLRNSEIGCRIKDL